MIYLYETFKSVIPVFVILSVLVFILTVAIDLKFKVKDGVMHQIARITIHFGLIMSFIGIGLVTGLPSDNPEKLTQFEPFRSITDTYLYATDYAFFNAIVMNIILFVPFSMFFYLATSRLILTFVLSFFLSVGIEVLQYILPIGRISNVDDVILNTAGAVIGIIIGVIMKVFASFGGKKEQDKGAIKYEDF